MTPSEVNVHNHRSYHDHDFDRVVSELILVATNRQSHEGMDRAK